MVVYSSSAKNIWLPNLMLGTSWPLQSWVIRTSDLSLSLIWGRMHIDSAHINSIMAALVYSFLIWTLRFYMSSLLKMAFCPWLAASWSFLPSLTRCASICLRYTAYTLFLKTSIAWVFLLLDIKSVPSKKSTSMASSKWALPLRNPKDVFIKCDKTVIAGILLILKPIILIDDTTIEISL